MNDDSSIFIPFLKKFIEKIINLLTILLEEKLFFKKAVGKYLSLFIVIFAFIILIIFVFINYFLLMIVFTFNFISNKLKSFLGIKKNES